MRRAATAALFARMGHRQGAIDSYANRAPASPRDWDRLADAHWGAGRYGEALKAWERASAATDPVSRTRLAERHGAILWIRGQLVAAERHLWRAITIWCTPDSPAGQETSAALLETYGRVVQHMRRLPDVRWFVSRHRVQEAERRLGQVRTVLSGHEGVALRARLANVASALQRQPDEHLSEHVEAFTESEALHAWLNYQHAWLRQRSSRQSEVEMAPARTEYEWLVRRQSDWLNRRRSTSLLAPSSATVLHSTRIHRSFSGGRDHSLASCAVDGRFHRPMGAPEHWPSAER